MYRPKILQKYVRKLPGSINDDVSGIIVRVAGTFAKTATAEYLCLCKLVEIREKMYDLSPV